MPQTLGRYNLQHKIAAGGMAEIWLASLLGPNGFASRVVVKTILPHLAHSPDFIQMFLGEAKLAAQLHHPNIAQIFDLGDADGTYFIAMEYVPGVDLRRLYRDAVKRQKPLPLPLALRIVIDVARALAYAHTALSDRGEPLRIVHRDVSPENILVTYQGGVKLVDFGIAKAADQLAQTQTGVVKGKFAYMAPERLNGNRVDGRSDQFSLAIVAYEILTGFRIFKRDSDVATLQAIASGEVPLPSTLNPKVPLALDPILVKALARKPGDRYPDCTAFALALEGFLHQGGYEASATHLTAYLAEIYPSPASPPPFADAETQPASDMLPGLSPKREQTPITRTRKPERAPTPVKMPALAATAEPSPAPLPLAPARETPSVGPRRLSQLAPRGPIRDPSLPPLPERPPPSKHGLGTSAQRIAERVESNAQLRARGKRWIGAALKVAFLIGLAALGRAAFPGLRHAFDQLLEPAPKPQSLEDVAGPHGRLSLDSVPAATVLWGARTLGQTPFYELEVPAGRLKLRLVNEADALDEPFEVTVHPNQTTIQHARFPEGTLDLPVPPGHNYRVMYRKTFIGVLPGPALQLAAGTHELVLIDVDTGQRDTRRVTVLPR